MKQIALALALALMAGPAFAFQCPADMAKIDEALEAGTELSEEQLAMVMELRAEGEELHASGQHQQSVDALHEAMTILGIAE